MPGARVIATASRPPQLGTAPSAASAKPPHSRAGAERPGPNLSCRLPTRRRSGSTLPARDAAPKGRPAGGRLHEDGSSQVLTPDHHGRSAGPIPPDHSRRPGTLTGVSWSARNHWSTTASASTTRYITRAHHCPSRCCHATTSPGCGPPISAVWFTQQCWRAGGTGGTGCSCPLPEPPAMTLVCRRVERLFDARGLKPTTSRPQVGISHVAETHASVGADSSGLLRGEAICARELRLLCGNTPTLSRALRHNARQLERIVRVTLATQARAGVRDGDRCRRRAGPSEGCVLMTAAGSAAC